MDTENKTDQPLGKIQNRTMSSSFCNGSSSRIVYRDKKKYRKIKPEKITYNLTTIIYITIIKKNKK